MIPPETKANDVFGNVAEAGNPLLRWREYLHILYDRGWLAVTLFFVVVISTVIWNGRQVPMYRSSATLHIDMFANKVMDLPNSSVGGTPAYMFSQYINTQVRALSSRIFIERVEEALKKSNDPDAIAFLKSTRSPVSVILSGLSVSSIENSQLIKIKMVNEDSVSAALLANVIAAEFIERDLSRRMVASMSALKWLKEQADTQREKVKAAEMALQEYRETSDMVSLEDHQNIVDSKLKDISAALTQAENKQRVARTKWEKIVTLLEEGTALDNIPSIASDPVVINEKKLILEHKSKIASLELRYKHKHPVIIEAQEKLYKAKVVYTKACMESKNKAKRDYKFAKANAEALGYALKRQEREAMELSRMMVEYNALKRNAEADKELYQSIIVCMKQTDVAGKLNTTNMRMNDRAYAASAPFTPQKTKNIIRASVAGAVSGLLLILIVHLMDDRVRRIEDFEVSLGIPVLGLIPRVKQSNAQQRASASYTDHHSEVAEAFRGLQASIMLDNAKLNAKVIMVISSGSGDGKSLVSSNLASVFAQNGERTLLIDADLRRPSQHKLFDIKSKVGLAHFILGQNEWDDSVIHTEQDSLDLLPGIGMNSSANSSRLIASPKMKSILDEARVRYDRIIVDCPPIFGISDSLLLFPVVDGIIFVAQYNRTHIRAIREATQKIMDCNAPFIGAVINNVKYSSHSYYYHRHGYNKYFNDDARKG